MARQREQQKGRVEDEGQQETRAKNCYFEMLAAGS